MQIIPITLSATATRISALRTLPERAAWLKIFLGTASGTVTIGTEPSTPLTVAQETLVSLHTFENVVLSEIFAKSTNAGDTLILVIG